MHGSLRLSPPSAAQVPEIEECESQMHAQLKRHQDQLRERRQHTMRTWKEMVFNPRAQLPHFETQCVWRRKRERRAGAGEFVLFCSVHVFFNAHRAICA